MQLSILEDQDGEYKFATHKLTPPQLDKLADSLRKLAEMRAKTSARLERLRDTLLAMAEEDADVSKPSP